MTESRPVYIPEPPETFTERNTREPLTEIHAGKVVAWFFDGVKFLHANGTIHGGLYPRSIKIKHSGPWSIQLTRHWITSLCGLGYTDL